MEIRLIKKIKIAQIANWGFNGYISNKIYEIVKNVEGEKISFVCQLTDLKTPYKKTFSKIDAEDIEDYNEVLEENCSFGAFVNNVMVGMIICDDMDWNNTLSIDYILIAESHRRKGTGKLLLQHVLEHAKKKKKRLVELETQNTNGPAIEFFQKQGFIVTGLNIKQYDPKEDGNEIAIFMSCEIN